MATNQRVDRNVLSWDEKRDQDRRDAEECNLDPEGRALKDISRLFGICGKRVDIPVAIYHKSREKDEVEMPYNRFAQAWLRNN